MAEISHEELSSRQGLQLYEVHSNSASGFFDLVATDTRLEIVQVNPNNPRGALINLEQRRKENAKGYIPSHIASMIPVVDGCRRITLDGDIVGGAIEILAGLMIEYGVQFMGMRVQQRIDLLRNELNNRMERAYIKQLIAGQQKTKGEVTQTSQEPAP